MLKKTKKNELRLRRHQRVRNTVSGTPDCPRLNVFRSNANIYAQVIDDTTGKTLVSSSSLVLKLENGGNIEAAKAVGKVIPELNGRLNGNAIRVPVTDGSICDCTLLLKKPATVEEINAAEKEAAEGELKGVLGYNEDQIVSSDILGRTEGSIFDATLTRLIPAGDYTFVKVASWYDNEYSFTCQMRRLAKLYGEILSK